MTTFAERAAAGIVQCGDDDLPELRRFQAEMGTGRDGTLVTASVEWLRRNPNAGGAAGIWICRRDGRIVGQQAQLPFQLQVAGQLVRAAAPVELVVAPAWRLKGVGPALSETQRKAVRVAVALGITAAALRMYAWAGWVDLGSLWRRVFVVRPPARWRSRPSAKSRARMMAVFPVAAALSAYTVLRSWVLARKTQLVPADRFDDRSDVIWREAAPSYPVIACRDQPSLRWRFDECPDAERYQRFYLLADEHPIGYFVVREAQWRRMRTLKVVDYLAPPALVPVLFARAVGLARAQGFTLVEAMTRNVASDKALKAMGLLHVERIERRVQADSGMRMMLSVAGDDPVKGRLADPRAWFVTSADADLDLLDLAKHGTATSGPA